MDSASSIRVVAADDHPLVLRGIASVFQASNDIELVAQASNGSDALRYISSLRPDVVLLNLHMPDMSGFEVIAALRDVTLTHRYVILTSKLTHEEFMEAMQLNVHGIILKKMPTSLLTLCVRMVHAGQVFIEKDMFRTELGKFLQHSASYTAIGSILTARELTVVQHAVNGLSNKHLARELGIAEGTVKLHLHRAYAKLRVHGRLGLIQMAHKRGLI